jgi:phage terminase large subunit GpA-like protein
MGSMMKMPDKALKRLNGSVGRAVRYAKPPEVLTVTEWADRYRVLSPENGAEAGPWRTARTPYLAEIMDALTDPKVSNLVLAAASQVGKTEMELNMLGYIIDNDPGPVMFIVPNIGEAQKFSKQRIAPMIRDTPRLRERVADVKTRNSNNTILQKSFPGGTLTLAGANSPAALASIPSRYVFGDERDRWAASAGTEGDPWKLAEARTATFYNRKLVEVSTPTVRGASAIERAFDRGTRERWRHQCPECGEWVNIVFDDIKFTHTVTKVKRRREYAVTGVWWACPKCGCAADERAMRAAPAKWIAETPDAYTNGVRSFWLNAFSSPWKSWDGIVLNFLQAKDSREELQAVFNTVFGDLWEERNEIIEDDALLSRREDYGETAGRASPSPTDVPRDAYVLTCGVDVQDNRLEYEVVAHGLYGETWGVKYGRIIGKPGEAAVWARLDDVIGREWTHESGKTLTISATFVDSGGHYTQEVYEQCLRRQNRRVFAIKGRGGSGVPYTRPPAHVPIRENNRVKCWLYTIGVDAGKASIMDSLKVQEPGAKYAHFPVGEARGYDSEYFNGLLSEQLQYKRGKNGDAWVWAPIRGRRNEPLDCRNYAMAAFRVMDVDMDAARKRFLTPERARKEAPAAAVRARAGRRGGGNAAAEW